MTLLLKIIKAALTKFSMINLTQFAGIATLIISSWAGADLISPGMLIMLTGLITLFLKWQQSTKEMVASGFSLDWMVYLSGLFGLLLGFFDTFISDHSVIDQWFGDKSKIILMIYMAVTIFIRTGFTNQSLNTMARK